MISRRGPRRRVNAWASSAATLSLGVEGSDLYTALTVAARGARRKRESSDKNGVESAYASAKNTKRTAKIIALEQHTDGDLLHLAIITELGFCHGRLALLDKEKGVAHLALADDGLAIDVDPADEGVGDLAAFLGLERRKESDAGQELFVHRATTMGSLENDGAERDAIEGPDDGGLDGKHGGRAGVTIHEREFAKRVARFAFGDLATKVGMEAWLEDLVRR